MKKIFMIIFMLIFMCIAHVSAEEIPTSGMCGENAVWSYSDGVLTISGSGTVDNPVYESRNTYIHPWSSYVNDIVEVRISKDITALGGNTFISHPALKKASLPANLTEIKYSVFEDCPMLCDIVLPESLTKIGSSAFEDCPMLRDIVLPQSLTEIGSSAFKGCTSLENISFPESLKIIGSSAFSGCSALNAVDFPENIEKIGDYAFSNCTGIKSIKIPTKLMELGDSAFAYTGIEEIYYPAQENPDAEIGIHPFQGCNNLKKAVLDENVTKLQQCMFWHCRSLREVILPPGITYIPNQVFEGCTSLTDITIPDGVTEIQSNAFKKCHMLCDIVLPQSLTEIGSSAFEGCTSLTEIIIPDGITKINSGLFNGCSSLKSVQLPDGITTIGGYAFSNCEKLENINMPKSLKSIYERAFSGCISLKELELPDGIETVTNYVFEKCGTMTVYFPPSIKEIGYGPFNDTNATIYARPETEIYGTGVKCGWTVYDYYLPNVGDVIDEIVDSDIYVTMNGVLIPSYCIDGKTLILLRDLERYGFDVWFDEAAKTAYAQFNPDKATYDGIATQLLNRNVLYTDIRAIVNGVEVEVRNSNGFIAVEAERLGNYVPEISCVWQSTERRLQMQAFSDMASFEDLVNSISDRFGIEYNNGCTSFADTDNGRFDIFVDRKYISARDYNGYIYPERGLRMADFVWVAGNAYEVKADMSKGVLIRSFYPGYLANGVIAMYQMGIIVPDENHKVYLDGILTKAQMEYYLDMLYSNTNM